MPRVTAADQVCNLVANINWRGGKIDEIKTYHGNSQHFYTVELWHGERKWHEFFDSAAAAFRWLQAYSYGMLEVCDK